MKKKVVTGIGELLWDMLPDGKQLGGAPCNFAYHALQAGCESFVVSAVGNDDSGAEIKDVIKTLGISDKFIQTNSHPTGIVSIKLDEIGHPDYTIHKNVAWDFISWENNLNNLAKQTDAICFGSLAQRNGQSGITIKKFMKAVSEDCLKVFDINLRQEFYSTRIIEESLKLANVLKLNEDELPIVASIHDLGGNTESQLEKLMELYQLKYIAYTMGSAGSFLLSEDESSFIAVPKVKVVDTIGAGDSFTAILIAGILYENPLTQIHKKATEVSAYVCTCKGATPFINKNSFQSTR